MLESAVTPTVLEVLLPSATQGTPRTMATFNSHDSVPSNVFAIPETFSIDSSNKDVKYWVLRCLLKNDQFLSHGEAWALAKKVTGRGQIAINYSKEDWEKQVPGFGEALYTDLWLSQKYVVC